jgi:hypothetical protein
LKILETRFNENEKNYEQEKNQFLEKAVFYEAKLVGYLK